MAEASAKPSRPLRIFHIITRFERAGSEENTALTINHQVKIGHEVTLICGAHPDSEMLRSLDDNVTLIELSKMVHPIDPLNDVAALRALRRIFKERHPDLVHTHQSKAGVLGRLGAKWAGVPHVVHTTHILPFLNVTPIKYFLYWSMEKIAGWCTDAFIHVSPAMEAATKAAGIGRKKLHRVIYSGMDLSRFKDVALPDDTEQLIPAYGTDQAPTVVLMLAAFEPRKRQHELVRLFEDVLILAPNTLLLLAGRGSEEQIVRDYIHEKKLEHQVKLLGYRTDPERLIALSDVCVIASQREGLPRSVIQYVAGGKPIIATALPGIEMLVQDGMNGLLVPPNELQQMVPRLIQLLQEEPLRREMGQQSARMDLSGWEASRMTEQIEALMEELANPALAEEQR